MVWWMRVNFTTQVDRFEVSNGLNKNLVFFTLTKIFWKHLVSYLTVQCGYGRSVVVFTSSCFFIIVSSRWYNAKHSKIQATSGTWKVDQLLLSRNHYYKNFWWNVLSMYFSWLAKKRMIWIWSFGKVNLTTSLQIKKYESPSCIW